MQTLDVQKARELGQQALELAGAEGLQAIAADLGEKARGLRGRLDQQALARLDEDGAREILDAIFTTRRRARAILAGVRAEGLGNALADLLHGPGEVGVRLDAFCDRMTAACGDAVPAFAWYDLAGECLHFTDPEGRWLWTRWVWDPDTGTGALPMILVSLGEPESRGERPSVLYRKVGEASAYLESAASAVGIGAIGPGPLAIDVYLATVFAQYLYMVTSVRTTDEFTGILPKLPEMTRRLLGVHRARP